MWAFSPSLQLLDILLCHMNPHKRAGHFKPMPGKKHLFIDSINDRNRSTKRSAQFTFLNRSPGLGGSRLHLDLLLGLSQWCGRGLHNQRTYSSAFHRTNAQSLIRQNLSSTFEERFSMQLF